MKTNIKQFAKLLIKEIKKYQYIIIFHHQRPDGDCLGSQQALRRWINLKYPDKKVYCIGSNENLFQFLNFQFDPIPDDQVLAQSLGIVVDANYANRIVGNEIILNKKITNLIRIDHHPESDDVEYKLRFVDPSYCASAEQIAHLIQVIDKKKIIDQEIATFLYLGIYTDSGRFFYHYTSSRTHQLVSWLFNSGFNFYDLHQKLAKRTIEEVNFNKYVLDHYQTYKNVIYCIIKKEDIKKLKISDSASNRVDFLANIQGFDIWIFFIEDSNNNQTYRVRFRSSYKDIAQLAREYQGGGHKNAAGAIINDFSKIDEIIKKASKI